jgi:hypothetical protein
MVSSLLAELQVVRSNPTVYRVVAFGGKKKNGLIVAKLALLYFEISNRATR